METTTTPNRPHLLLRSRRPVGLPPASLTLLVLFAWLAQAPPATVAEQPETDARQPVGSPTAGEDFFERHIRPLFDRHCISCHGEEAAGGLKLDSRRGVLVGGDSGPAVVPGEVDESLLLAVLRHDGELRMPPDEKLSRRQIEQLRDWVRQGAPWPEVVATRAVDAETHWAFQPVRRLPLPTVPAGVSIETPLDAFIVARASQAGLEPSPPADARTLIRRATYAVTGLPPTADAVRRFIDDADPAAYERLVDRLLASPQFGEQSARTWLDVARYSDTKGYVYAREERFWTHAWAYRDWVVGAFNSDLPYDRFLMLQLAADQVESATRDDLAAMGLLTLGRRFLGVKQDIIDDQIDVVTRGMLGLTVSCARCHNHKYDPIPTADYYSLYGVFDNSIQRRLPLAQPDDEQGDFWQPLAEHQRAFDEQLDAARASASQRARQRVAEYLQAQLELENYPGEGFGQIFQPTDLMPAVVHRWEAYLRRAARRRDPVFVPWHALGELGEDDFAAAAARLVRHWVQQADGTIHPLVLEAFATPPQSFDEVITRYAQLLGTIDQQWQQRLAKASEQGQSPPEALEDPAAERLRRVLYADDSPCHVPDQSLVHLEMLFDTDTTRRLWKLQGEVDRYIINHPLAVPFALTLADRSWTVEPRILRRGNAADPGAEVPRQFLELLSPADRQPFAHGSGRRELAHAIANSDNPLTARVMVNRVWKQLMGRGLVETPSDFGLRAPPPSNPELLDWLAAELVQGGWKLKPLYRTILLSATFRQASTISPDNEAHILAQSEDPENRLLWRMNPRRLSFEQLRDSILAVSGQLDLTVGGRPQPLFESPSTPRRTLYGLVDRQFLPSTLRVFDFANPDLHIPQRSETTVPQQALFFMNHPLVLDQTRQLASQLGDSADADTSIRQLFTRVLQRQPTSDEVAEAGQLLSAVQAASTASDSAASEAWHYGFGELDPMTEQVTSFTELPHFTGDAWQGGPQLPDPKLGWVRLTAEGGHPGNDLRHAAIRRWVAPESMTVTIHSRLVHDAEPGDGVRAHIVAAPGGILASEAVHQQSAELEVEGWAVQGGQTIDFIVDIREVLNSDQFLWEIEIERQDARPSAVHTWHSRKDFTPAAAALTPWQQLAQVMFWTNEFMFVD